MIIGILALQGDFALHRKMLNSINVNSYLVRHADDLDSCDALIIPGGESSVISKLIQKNSMYEKLINFSKLKSIFGTCAGMIMMSKFCNDGKVIPLKILDIEVERNGWGRQYNSFKCITKVDNHNFETIFIRAPKVKMVNENLSILSYKDKDPILISDGKHLAASFHPELTKDPTIHNIFIGLINKNNGIA